MSLTSAQLTTLKADIDANSGAGQDFEPYVGDLSRQANQAIADIYNQQAAPDYVVWKNLVSLEDTGEALDGQNLADITTANSERLQVFFIVNPGGVRPVRADHRAFFEDVFSAAAGVETRANLNGDGSGDDGLWRTLAARAEQVLIASGSGTNGSPGVLGHEGEISHLDVFNARSLP